MYWIHSYRPPSPLDSSALRLKRLYAWKLNGKVLDKNIFPQPCHCTLNILAMFLSVLQAHPFYFSETSHSSWQLREGEGLNFFLHAQTQHKGLSTSTHRGFEVTLRVPRCPLIITGVTKCQNCQRKSVRQHSIHSSLQRHWNNQRFKDKKRQEEKLTHTYTHPKRWNTQNCSKLPLAWHILAKLYINYYILPSSDFILCVTNY